jgi:hypothetical protein
LIVIASEAINAAARKVDRFVASAPRDDVRGQLEFIGWAKPTDRANARADGVPTMSSKRWARREVRSR